MDEPIIRSKAQPLSELHIWSNWFCRTRKIEREWENDVEALIKEFIYCIHFDKIYLPEDIFFQNSWLLNPSQVFVFRILYLCLRHNFDNGYSYNLKNNKKIAEISFVFTK